MSIFFQPVRCSYFYFIYLSFTSYSNQVPRNQVLSLPLHGRPWSDRVDLRNEEGCYSSLNTDLTPLEYHVLYNYLVTCDVNDLDHNYIIEISMWGIDTMQ